MDPERGNGHVVVIAASAGGKTAGIVIPNILHYNGPLVVIDPKGDLYARTRAAREAKGFKARVIDARNGFDPFKLIAPLAPTTPSVYLTMAKTLMPLQSRSSDISEYFHEMSCALFAALMAHFIEKGSNSVAADISRFINRERTTVIAEAKQIAGKHDLPLINDEMEGLAALDERTFPGVVKGISNKLAFVRFPDVASYGDSQESPDAHLAALAPDTDIFINVPTLAAKDFSSFPRLLIGAMYVACELLEQPDRPRTRRLFLIDEARVLGGMDALTNVRDAGRSIGMHLMLIYQSLGQLKEAWGGEAGADAWLDSCEARVVGAVGAARTASDIVTMLGRRTLTTRMAGSSASSPVMTPMGGSVSTSEQEQMREVPLMSVATLGQLPAHGSIIFTRRSKPILATKALYFTRKDMKNKVLSADAVARELEVTRRREALMKSLEEAADENDIPATAPETIESEAAEPDAPDIDNAARANDPSEPEAMAERAKKKDAGTEAEDGAAHTPERAALEVARKNARRAAHHRHAAGVRAIGQTPADPQDAPDVTSTERAEGPDDDSDPDQWAPVADDTGAVDGIDDTTMAAVPGGPQSGEEEIEEATQAPTATGDPDTEDRSMTAPDAARHEDSRMEATSGPGAAALTPSDQALLSLLEGFLQHASPEARRAARALLDRPFEPNRPGKDTTLDTRVAPDADAERSRPARPDEAGPSASAHPAASDIDPSAVEIEDGADRPDIARALPEIQTVDQPPVRLPDTPPASEPEATGQAPAVGEPPAVAEDPREADTAQDAAAEFADPDRPEEQAPDTGTDAATGQADTAPEMDDTATRDNAMDAPPSQDTAGRSAAGPVLGATQDEEVQDAEPGHTVAAGASPVRIGGESDDAPAPPAPHSLAEVNTGSDAPTTTNSKRTTFQRKPNIWEAEDVREALLDRTEDLFRQYIGEPVRTNTPEWRPKDDDAFSMNMRGEKRGHWNNFSAGTGGDLFDFVAVYFCGLAKAREDFPKVLEAAADYAGLSPTHSPTPAERDARAAKRAGAAAARKAEAAREAEEKRVLTHGIRKLAKEIGGSPAETYLRARGIARWPKAGLAWLPPLADHLDKSMLDKIHTPEQGAFLVWATGSTGKVGGQRILLNPDGTRVSGKITKPAFGRIAGAPAKLSLGHAPKPNEPLIVAEGPETALAILDALNRDDESHSEVWAVFGVSSWASAPLPTDRLVILAPDRDAPGSPADKAFRKAVDEHRARGVTLTVALAPEAEGSKRDLADTLKDQGADAVRAAIAAAPPVDGEGQPKDAGGDKASAAASATGADHPAEGPQAAQAPEAVNQASKSSSQGGRSPTPARREPPGTARRPLESTSASEDDDPDWINAILSQTDD